MVRLKTVGMTGLRLELQAPRVTLLLPWQRQIRPNLCRIGLDTYMESESPAVHRAGETYF